MLFAHNLHTRVVAHTYNLARKRGKMPSYALPKGKWVGGQNAYDMVKGFRELFELVGITLSQEPNAEEIQSLFDLVGKEKVFEKNVPAIAAALRLDGSTIPDQRVTNLLHRTGTLNRIQLRTVLTQVNAPRPKGSVVVIMPGATASWMERRIKLMKEQNLNISTMFCLASGTRRCDSSTELVNPQVMEFKSISGRLPYEYELQRVLLSSAGFHGARSVSAANSLEDNVRELFTERPELAHADIVAITNANATSVALQIRRIIRELWPDFDTKQDQFWFCQDSFPMATTPKQAANPARHQRPLTMIPALIRLVNEFYLLNGGAPLKAAV